MRRAPIRFEHPLKLGRPAQFDAPAAEALRARELRVSEACTILDSQGRYFRARILSLGERGGELLPYEQMELPTESPLELTLICAVLNRQRMIQVIPKATELGVSRVVPVLTERSVAPEGLEHEKAHSWPRQALRAVRQCRRAAVPEVLEARPLAEALEAAYWQRADLRLAMDDRAPLPERTREGLVLERGPRRVCLAVGPEGGWSDVERELLAGAGACWLRLGGRVLRAETAVFTGLVLLQHHLGDLAVLP